MEFAQFVADVQEQVLREVGLEGCELIESCHVASLVDDIVTETDCY